MTAEISIRNLKKRYPKGAEALKGIQLDVSKSGLFALLGPNGAGKSSLVKILTTLIRSDSGTVQIAGLNPLAHFTQLQKIIGVASQENDIDPAETVENMLVFQGRLFGMSKKAAQERAQELIADFELETERGKKAGALSGGNKRRLHCALALVHRPAILFLDEPTVGMDPEARARFWNIITRLNREEGVTVFLTTQYLEEADRHATEMAVITNGCIQYAGTVADFKKRVHPEQFLSLEESYLAFVSRPVESFSEPIVSLQ
jgi:ABC-2 type transport system ATP-binding protein